MKKTTVRLDDQIHTVLVRLAEQRGVSLNHLINYALVRFVSFEEAFEMLENRAHRAQSGAIKRALEHITAPAAPHYILRTIFRWALTVAYSNSV